MFQAVPEGMSVLCGRLCVKAALFDILDRKQIQMTKMYFLFGSGIFFFGGGLVMCSSFLQAYLDTLAVL